MRWSTSRFRSIRSRKIDEWPGVTLCAGPALVGVHRDNLDNLSRSRLFCDLFLDSASRRHRKKSTSEGTRGTSEWSCLPGRGTFGVSRKGYFSPATKTKKSKTSFGPIDAYVIHPAFLRPCGVDRTSLLS